MQSEFVLMDFDGVIVDSFNLCLSIVSQTNPSETDQTFRERFTRDSSRANLLESLSNAGSDFFTEYSKKIIDQPLFPGIADALEFIGGNFTTILVSSSISPPIKQYLQQHNLTRHFSALFCNDIPNLKADKFKLLLQHYQVKPTECVFVTDTLGDILEAKHVLIPSIGVTWGYHPAALLREGNPQAVIDYPSQLKGAIEEAMDFSVEYDEG
jgi:phosphoglycolate phosphatase